MAASGNSDHTTTPTNAHRDVVVLGSGGAALAAAVTAAHSGLSVTVIERAAVIGGTSAISGGALWIPGTRQAKAGGFADSIDNARTYLKAVLGDCYDSPLVETFLARGPEALAFLEDHTELKYSVRALSPDYYPETVGATDCGRALEVAEFDGKRLGEYFGLLRIPPNGLMLFGGLMLSRIDVHHFLNMRRSVTSLLHCARLIARFARDRISYPRGTRLVIGNAMIAALLRSALDKGVEFRLGAVTEALLTSSDRTVCGVSIRNPSGEREQIFARGVVLATGGISRSPQTASERPDTRTDHISMAAPLADGTAIELALKLGAQLGRRLRSSFYWAPMSAMKQTDGTAEVFPHIVTDRAKPGVIAVNDQGVRFVNEANSYHRFVEAMMAEQRKGIERFFLIADHSALTAYGLGLARPRPGNNRKLIEGGYLIEAATIADLARRLAIDPQTLDANIAEFNRDAKAGVDRAFNKGASSYNRAMGDANAPSPCLAPVATAPFYAVQIHTGDLGSAKGLVTDTDARVLRSDGSCIRGLYAAGSDMNSVMAGAYPGPGITLGPGLTFGYIAARTIVGEARSSVRA